MKVSYTLLTLMLLIQSSLATATHIESRVDNQGQYFSVVDLPLPEKLLNKEMTSGLPNNVSVIVKLYHQQKLITQTRVNTKIIYDLWDEVFIVETFNPPSLLVNRYAKKSNLMAELREFNLSALLSNNEINIPANKLTATVQVIYNPVDKERIKRVQQWIRENNGYSQLNTEQFQKDNLPPNNSGNGLRFKKLFDKIIDDYIPEEGFSAQWKSTVIKLQLPSAEKQE